MHRRVEKVKVFLLYKKETGKGFVTSHIYRWSFLENDFPQTLHTH